MVPLSPLFTEVQQDIKPHKKPMRGTAPRVFLIIICTSWLVLFLSGLFYGLNIIKKTDIEKQSTEAQKNLKDIKKNIDTVQKELDNLEAVKKAYAERQVWLQGNYTSVPIYMKLFKSIPEGSRIVYLAVEDLNKLTPSNERTFSLSLRLKPLRDEAITVAKFNQNISSNKGWSMGDINQDTSITGLYIITANLYVPVEDTQ